MTKMLHYDDNLKAKAAIYFKTNKKMWKKREYIKKYGIFSTYNLLLIACIKKETASGLFGKWFI